jgi:hypothetical protein
MKHFAKIYERLFVGGGVTITKVGPKDARIEIVGLPLARIAYFKHAYRGLIKAGCDLFASRSFCNVLPACCSPLRLGYRLAWA